MQYHLIKNTVRAIVKQSIAPQYRLGVIVLALVLLLPSSLLLVIGILAIAIG